MALQPLSIALSTAALADRLQELVAERRLLEQPISSVTISFGFAVLVTPKSEQTTLIAALKSDWDQRIAALATELTSAGTDPAEALNAPPSTLVITPPSGISVPRPAGDTTLLQSFITGTGGISGLGGYANIAVLTATDPDQTLDLTFSISSDASWLFDISGSDLRLVNLVTDYSLLNGHQITVRATDIHGLTREQPVRVEGLVFPLVATIDQVIKTASFTALAGQIHLVSSFDASAMITITPPVSGDFWIADLNCSSATRALAIDAGSVPASIRDGIELTSSARQVAVYHCFRSMAGNVMVMARAIFMWDTKARVTPHNLSAYQAGQGYVVNHVPGLIVLSTQTIPVTTAGGQAVAGITGIDPDPGDTITFTLVSDSSAKFEIVGLELRVLAGQTLSVGQATIVIRAEDNHGATTERFFILTIA